MSRYRDRKIIANDMSEYKNLFEPRNLTIIKHHRQENNLNIPEIFKDTIIFEQEIWGQETKLHKLSYKYYKTTEHWWVIGLINNKPTDVEWKIGDIILIPNTVNSIIEFISLNRINGGI